MSNRRMKRIKLSKEEESTIKSLNILRDKYESFRKDVLKAFGIFYCKHTMNIPFYEKESRSPCSHVNIPDNKVNYNHYLTAIFVKNVLVWLDLKMKYLNNISILKDPVRKFKVSHIVQNEEVTRYYLHYQPQEENTNTVSNDNENLAIAGPSRNVREEMNLDETSSDNICSLYTKNVSTFESSSSSISKKPDKKLELDKILNKSPVRSFTEKISNSATHSNKMTQKTKIETLSFQSTDIDEINFSINSTIQVDKNMYVRNSKGETKMHIACAKGNINLVASLLVDGFNPNVKDNAGWAPMHEAVRNGHLEIVKLLIKYGALLNVPGFEYESPLHTAIRYNHFDIAVILLQNGAYANDTNIYGNDAQSLNPEKWSELFRNNNIELRQPSSIIHLYNYKSDQIIVFPMKLTLKNSIVKHFSKKFDVKIVKNILNNEVKLAQITHIVVPNTESNVCDVNLECLIGIANGLFIVNESWISDSLKKNKLLDCIPFEINGTTKYPNISSSCTSRSHKQKLYPKLFDGISVHINGNIGWEQFTRDNLKQLVLEFGAKLLNRFPNPEDCPTNVFPYYCRYSEQLRNVSTIVLYTEDSHRLIKYNMNHLKVFPISWFMEVVLKYSLVNNS